MTIRVWRYLADRFSDERGDIVQQATVIAIGVVLAFAAYTYFNGQLGTWLGGIGSKITSILGG